MNGNQKGSGAKANNVREAKECRMCASHNLRPFFDLGMQPLANSLCLKENLETEEPHYPLGLLFCADCGLTQLRHIVNPKLLFPDDYVYHSSGIPSLPHFTKYAEELHARFLSGGNKFVVEIGSNDGHLLYLIQKPNVRVLGVDPAQHVAAVANGRGIPTRTEFFSAHAGRAIQSEHGHADVIIANNVFAHIDDHHDLMRGVVSLLAPRGVFIIEAPYLGDMFDNIAFDSVYHEHMSYLSLRPLAAFLETFGLEVFDARQFPVQGNSLRYYAARKNTHSVDKRVALCLASEEKRGFDKLSTYEDLVKKIEMLRKDVRDAVKTQKNKGKKVAAYGAPARGNTLLNYFGIDHTMLDFATEALGSKIGKYTPGTHIPIVDIAWARQHAPDYYLLLAWPYKNIIFEKEKDFILRGGKFIMPVGNNRIMP